MIKLLFSSLLLISFFLSAQGLGPLLGAAQYDLYLINEQGQRETLTVIPDAQDKEQFYYLPTRPRLAVQVIGTLKGVPMFQFTKYSFAGADDNLVQGGMIQFGVTLALPEQMLQQAQEKLAKFAKVPENRVRLGLVPITSAQATLLATEKKGIVTEVLGSTEGARYPGSVMPFAVYLTPQGAALYEKMVQGTAGIGIYLTYSYCGLTPYVNCRVRGSWDKVYTHYSQSHSARLTLKSWWFGGSSKVDWQKVRDDLLDNGDVTIEWTPRPDESKEEGKRLVHIIEEGILSRITKAVFSQKPPQAGEKPAQAQAENVGGYFGGLNYALAIKDIERRRQGKISFSYRGRSRIEVKGTPVGGFANVASVPSDVKKVMFLDVQRDDFFNSLKISCLANLNPQPFGIQEIKYAFSWRDTVKERVFVADRRKMVSLAEIEHREKKPVCFVTGGEREPVKFWMEITVQNGARVQTVVGPKRDLAINGRQVVGFHPEKNGFDMVHVDFRNLMFFDDACDAVDQGENIDPRDCPRYIAVKLCHGHRKYSFRAISDDKDSEVIWPIVHDQVPVTCSIVAKYKKRPRRRQYRRNGEKNLKKGETGLTIIVDNDDFRASR